MKGKASRLSHLVSSSVFAFSLLFNVEAQVFQQDDGSGSRVGAGSLHVWTDTVLQEGDVSAAPKEHVITFNGSRSKRRRHERKRTRLPSRLFSSAATGSREYFSGMAFPSGRPRWLISTTLLAPWSRQCWMLGTAALILINDNFS